MDQQLFTDGIGRITVIGGIVRVDLVTYSATETDANGKARPVLTQRVLMGVDAFLRSSEKILETVQAITRAQQQQRAVPAPQPKPQTTTQPQVVQQPGQQPRPQSPPGQTPPPLPQQENIAPQPHKPAPPRPPFP